MASPIALLINNYVGDGYAMSRGGTVIKIIISLLTLPDA
jgi:hypothetical protein